MSSTLLEFNGVNEKEVEEFSEALKAFLASMFDPKYWDVVGNCFGPIRYHGCLRDPRDGSYSISVQVWSDHAETLFCVMDEFLDRYKSSLVFQRSDV